MNKKKEVLLLWTGAVGWFIWYLCEIAWYQVTSILNKNQQRLSYILDQNMKKAVNFSILRKWSKRKFSNIIVATKTYDIQKALNIAEWYLKDDGHILVIQNGLHDYDVPKSLHWNISKSVIYVISQRVDNVIVKTSSFSKLIVENTTNKVFDQLIHSLKIELEVVSDIKQKVREKYIHISSYSWIICSTWYTIWEIMENPLLYNKYVALINEIYKIALQEWYKWEKNVGDYIEISKLTDTNSYCSLYHDLEKWKKTEFNEIIWSIYHIAKDRWINSPIISSVYSLIKKKYIIL